MEVDTSHSVSPWENAALVQSDWHLAIKEGSTKIYTGVRNNGSSTEKNIYFDLLKSNGYACCNDSIDAKVENNLLHIVSKDVDTRFVAPVGEFDAVHRSSVISLDVSSSGNLLLTSDTEGHLTITSLIDGNVLRELCGHLMDVYKCRFFPNGLVVLSAGMDMSLRIWSVETGDCVRVFSVHKQAVSDIAIIGQGKEVMSCSLDGSVIRWNCGTSDVAAEWQLESGRCNALALSKDDSLFSVACESKKIVVGEAVGCVLYSFDTLFPASTVCFDSNANSIVFAGDEEGILYVHNAKTSETKAMKTTRGKVHKILTSDRFLIVSYNDGTVCAYDLNVVNEISSPLYEFTGADCDPVFDMCIHGTHLFTCSRDKVIRKYNIPDKIGSSTA